MILGSRSSSLGHPLSPHPTSTLTKAGLIEYADVGKGVPFLALHGGLGGYDQSWLLARALLSDLSPFRVLAVSRPGYLGTALAMAEAAEGQADAYAALLDALSIDATFVAAVSAGGPSALQFALRHPDRCKGLILVSTATGRLDTAPKILSRLRLMSLLARIPGVLGFLERRTLREPKAAAHRAIQDPLALERTFAHPEAGRLLTSLQAGVMERLSERLPGTRNDIRMCQGLGDFPFEKIVAPVLVIHGTSDRVVPFAHGKSVADRAPNAAFLSIEGGEHVALFADLDRVRQAVARFVAPLL